MRAGTWLATGTAIALIAVNFTGKPTAAPALAAGQGTSTLDDQVELSLTVYNTDLALIRDVRNVDFPSGSFDLEVHGHRRDRQPRHGPLPLAHGSPARARRGAELRVRPPRARQAAAQIRRPRRHAGTQGPGGRLHAGRSGHRTAGQLQQRPGLEDRQRDRDRAAGGSHPVPGAPGKSLQPPDADLDAGQRRSREASRRSGLPRRQAVVERRLRADGRPRRQVGRPRRLGHAREQQRHVVPPCLAAARRRAVEPRPPGHGRSDGATGGGRKGCRCTDGAGVVLRVSPVHARPQDDDQQRRDETGQHAEWHRRAGAEALRRGRA